MRSQEIGGVSADDVVKVGGALGLLWGIVRFLVGPRIHKSLREALKDDLQLLHEAAETAKRTADEMEGLLRQMRRLNDDLEVLEVFAHDNRGWMVDLHAFLDQYVGIDRREGERRKLPEIPAWPDRRRRDRRTEE